MSPYQHLQDKLAADQCIILDGAIGTELQRQQASGFELSDDLHWGFDALYSSPDVVRDVHRSYISAGADIITTNTYAILDVPGYTANFDLHEPSPVNWLDMTRDALRLPRKVRAEAGAENSVAIAFSIGGEIATEEHRQTLNLLHPILRQSPPDLILFETLSLIEDNTTLDSISRFLDDGFPVWVSFRRSRKGVCGIHGQLWGGPEGDRFGRLAHRLEQMGVGALMINCIPTRRVDGTLPWLRDFTDLPLGVYPNVGRYSHLGWKFDDDISDDGFAAMALKWRHQGAQIIGGCCGVGPDEIKATTEILRDQPVGAVESTTSANGGSRHADADQQWQDSNGNKLYPLPLPDISVEKGVFVPTQGSYLIWKNLFLNDIGKDLNCLDIGCGCGILTVQLALNGASSVTGIDISKESVENTMVNAYRNGVADRCKSEVVDLYIYQPDEPFDLIVASLYQMPTSPIGNTSGHRDIDFWGRNLLDHFLLQLPLLLQEGGVAYVMQVSMLGARRTQELLSRNGYQCEITDFNLYQFNPVFSENLDQIRVVESLSDAFHFEFDDKEQVMVMYLLKVTQAKLAED
ncbi:MAG: homocysteine S-methyltransferase family protein [Pseudomonadota bacterium]